MILQVHDVTKRFGGLQALTDVTFDLRTGEILGLIGPNGVGKTTLLKTVMGLMAPIHGSVSFQGEDVTNLSAHARANAGMVLVPEGRQLFTEMTIYENLEMGAFSPRARAAFNQNLDKVYELFPRLKERTRQKAGTLSGGEQQMVAVGRGLMAEPEVLMLDELSLGLSPLLALTLDIHEMYHLLDTIKVKSLMPKRLFTITPGETVEKAAAVMLKRHISALPVVDAQGTLAGIITKGDIFRAFVSISGIYQGPLAMALELPDEPGSIKTVTDVIRAQGGRIASILIGYEGAPEGSRHVFIRAKDIKDQKALRQELEAKSTVLYFMHEHAD